LGIILFFTLKPDPEVPEGMAPTAAIVFFNTFDAFRNQLAFGLFRITALLRLMGKRIVNWKQIVAVAAIAILILALEIAQVWMRNVVSTFMMCSMDGWDLDWPVSFK
jgi:hypothetical protein